MARVRFNESEGIDLQVIYPTLFLAYPLATDPSLAAALCRSYNSWMHDACRGSDGRLKWVAVVSLDDVSSATEEMRRCRRELDAVGVVILGTVGERDLDHPSLAPFWATAAELDTPVSVHVGWPCPPITNLVNNIYDSVMVPFTFPTLMGFNAIVGGGILDQHPTLRVAFLELSCQWIPFWVDRMNHFYDFAVAKVPAAKPPARRRPIDYLRSGQLFVTCEVEDRLLPQVLEMMGEDHIFFASDIPHGDREPHAAAELKERQDISEVAKRKILYDNAARFYGL
jgi:predicted TIM-barrel fold metal-dependent hydrolase